MNKSGVLDMTEGKELPLIAKFAVPMLIGNLFQQLYNMVDSIVVGNYVGANALAAVGATGSIHFLFFSLCNGLATGIGILISQFFGAKDEVRVKKSIGNTLYLILSTGILMSALQIFLAEPVLRLMGTPEAIINDSVLYMQITGIGTLAVAFYNAVSGALRALGDSKTPLIFLIVASFLNVFLDLLFVIQFSMGVAGVAIATIVAQAVSAIGALLFAICKNPYFRLQKEHLKFDRIIIMKAFRLGLPVALQSSMIAFSCVVLQKAVNEFGENVVAAFTTTSRIEQLVQQPYASFGAAMATFAGQNMGARKVDRVVKGYHKTVWVTAAFSAVMLLLAYLFGDDMVHLFVKETEVIDIGSKALRITSLFYFPLGLIYVSRGLLNGAGDAMYSMINGIVEVACRLTFSNTLVLIPVIGVWGVFLATALTWFITGIASVIRYKQGKWKTKDIVST